MITLLYVAAVERWSPDLSPTGLEIFGTATSLACVWLTRTQNIWSVIYGLLSVVAMGIFFFDIDLVGQGWLHLGYYIPIQFVGWWAWLRGGAGRCRPCGPGASAAPRRTDQGRRLGAS